MNNNPKDELLAKIKSSSNVLVTVNRNPSVDQLAASISLSLMLNKLDKHSTTVFSGLIPDKLDFLEPEKTIETNTDSLRDFIISLDKEKADKLKYKQEDGQVKIFITPYRTSISEEDLDFSQGDFNVDLIIVLGAVSREELDQAIISHGRILHDATIATIGVTANNTLGSINYSSNSSSICEILSGLSDQIGENLLDNQIATALLTGIVSETERFSNNKTTSETLAISSKLVAAGANQQLVATKLSESTEAIPPEAEKPTVDSNLKIYHDDTTESAVPPVSELPAVPVEPTPPAEPLATEEPVVSSETEPNPTEPSSDLTLSEIEEANRIGKLSSLELPKVEELAPPEEEPIKLSVDNKPELNNIDSNVETITDDPIINPLSGQLNSSALSYDTDPNPNISTKDEFINEAKEQLDQARLEVESAMLDTPQPIRPIESLNAQPVIEVDHQELNEDHNIKVDEDGQIIIQNEESEPTVNESTPHELKLNPIHDLKKNVLDNLSQDSPPPVPPPIPLS